MGNRSEDNTYVLHHPFVFFEVCKSCEHISSFRLQTNLAFYGNYSIYARCIALFFCSVERILYTVSYVLFFSLEPCTAVNFNNIPANFFSADATSKTKSRILRKFIFDE